MSDCEMSYLRFGINTRTLPVVEGCNLLETEACKMYESDGDNEAERDGLGT
jgi:hypothetical protein